MDFPTVYWSDWDAEASFLPGEQLPEESRGLLWAVLAFVFYGDKIVLADIEGRGWTIPSGKIEPGEAIDAAVVREVFEETGAALSADRRRLIGCYRLVTQSGEERGRVRYCPVLITEALGFENLPPGSESQGILLCAIEDVADLYFFWDSLMASVFAYAESQKNTLFPPGLAVSQLLQS